MYNYSYFMIDISVLFLGGIYNVFLVCVVYNYIFFLNSVSCKK